MQVLANHLLAGHQGGCSGAATPGIGNWTLQPQSSPAFFAVF